MGVGCRQGVISRYKAGEGCIVGLVEKSLGGVSRCGIMGIGYKWCNLYIRLNI